MNPETMFERLNGQETLTERRQALKEYLLGQVGKQRQHPEQSQHIAYDIAGLLATNFAASLAEDDEYKQILDMAGELELSEEQRGAGVSWAELGELVERLP